MYRRLLFAFSLIAALSFSAQAVTVSVPATTTAQSGASVQIPVSVDNPEGIAGFQFTLGWGTDNSVLESLNVAKGSLTDGWFIEMNKDTAGQVTVIGLGFQPLSGSTTGSLCVIEFRVTGSTAQTANLAFSATTLVDAEGETIASTTSGGVFTVQAPTPGTVNGTITYGGAQTNKVVFVGLFTSTDFSGEAVYYDTFIYPAASTYSIASVAPGTYYAAAFMQVTAGETTLNPLLDPSGAYGGTTPTSFTVSAGQASNNINITLTDPVIPVNRAVSIQRTTGAPGSIVNVPVNIDQCAGVAKFRFVVAYDETIVEDTGAVRGSLLPANWLVLSKRLEAGKVEVTGQVTSGQLIGGSGTLVNMRFKVNSAATIGQISPLTFSGGTNNETNFLKDISDALVSATYTDSELEVAPSLTLNLKAGGWNLVSLSVDPTVTNPQTLFGAHLLGIFEWNGTGYAATTVLQSKKGYWIAVDQDISVEVAGSTPVSSTVHLVTGWNLVGPIANAAVPSGATILGVYGWNGPPANSYAIPGTCAVGNGFWVAASQATDIW